MFAKRVYLLLFIAAIIFPATRISAQPLRLAELKCEYRINPLGIDVAQPRLSWVIETKRRGEKQTAYQILAASSYAKLLPGKADLWDSGKVDSSESINAIYAGKALTSGERVYWQVRIWDADGKASAYCAPVWYETGLMAPEDWQAKWIQRPKPAASKGTPFDDHPAPLFRKQFELVKPIKRARAYASGLGYFELRLNGERVGNEVLNPGWTTYTKRVLYSTYDVTSQLKRGQNALGIMLGNGWFNPLPLAMWGRVKPGDSLTTGEPRAILQVVIEFKDGTTQTISTDDSWGVTDGPILRNSVYLGEFYDARRELPDWDRADFDDSKWSRAVLAGEPQVGPLRAQDAPPIRITRTFKAVKLTQPKPGVYIFDFGQNFAGWARLHVHGERGTCVHLRSGELLYPDGTLNGMTVVVGQIKGGGKDYKYDGIGQPKTAFQLDEYTLKGQGPETYTPRFTFHGFRYVEVTGFPGKPTLETLDGLGLNTDVAPVGTFECSNELLNGIQKMVTCTELANLFSVQSDCPGREKFGYGGDVVASSEMGMLNFDMSRFYAKVAQDFMDAARNNGGITETAPYVGLADQNLGDVSHAVNLGENSGSVDWGVAQPLLAWQLYQYYGDRRLMREQYEITKKWIALLESKAQNNLLDNGISDHESLAPKPRYLTGSAFYYFNVKLLARIAKALGEEADAAQAEAKAEEIKAAFNHEFLKSGTGRYDIGSQACQAFAIYMGLVPEEEKAHALDALVQDVVETNKGHLTTGIFGTKFMLDALTDSGRADVAYQMVNQRTFPGWGFMLEKGATTLWEHWEFSDNTYSHDHPMFGSVSEWLYKSVAGIKPAPDAVGFDKIIIEPQPVGDLKSAKASYDSVRGKVVSEWSKADGQFKLKVRIPVGAIATVILPAQSGTLINEGGIALAHKPEIKLLRSEGGKAVMSVPSGEYNFTSTVQ